MTKSSKLFEKLGYTTQDIGCDGEIWFNEDGDRKIIFDYEKRTISFEIETGFNKTKYFAPTVNEIIAVQRRITELEDILRGEDNDRKTT